MTEQRKRYRVYQRGNAPTWAYASGGLPVIDHGFFDSFDQEADAIKYAAQYNAEVRDGTKGDQIIWLPGHLIGDRLR